MKQLGFPARPMDPGLVTEYAVHFSHLDAALTTVTKELYLKDADDNVILFPAHSLMEIEVQVEEVFNSGTSDVFTVGDLTAVNTYLVDGTIDETTVGMYPALTVVRRFRPAAAFSVRVDWVATYGVGLGPTTGECTVIVKITAARAYA